jgi:outer membrane receptor for Fe3+-dicitrate
MSACNILIFQLLCITYISLSVSRRIVIKSDCSEKRYESGTEVDQYYSVELSIPDAGLIYQFRIWNLSSRGICIVVKKDSDLLEHLKVGNILNMKYYPTDSSCPTEYLKTQIKHITKDKQGRFRNHVLVGLFILEKQ